MATNFTPAEFLGIPQEAVAILKDTLTYTQYLSTCIAILEMRKQETKEDYMTDLFKKRSKVADDYRDWLVE